VRSQCGKSSPYDIMFDGVGLTLHGTKLPSFVQMGEIGIQTQTLSTEHVDIRHDFQGGGKDYRPLINYK
jgi:hypothetical protein